jgi:hypothetical protein
MVNTDMIVWRADLTNPTATDLWSTSYGTPLTDVRQDVKTTEATLNIESRSVHFTSERSLDTGDQQDFIVPVDQTIYMCYAAHTQTSNLVYHEAKGYFAIRLNADGTMSDPMNSMDLPEGAAEHFFDHGIIMAITWLLLGYLMLATQRYAKALWKSTYYLHAFLGYVIFTITVYQSIISFKKLGGLPEAIAPHHIIGPFVFALVPIVTFSGSATFLAGKSWWNIPQWRSNNEEKISKIARFHRLFGYFTLFCGV